MARSGVRPMTDVESNLMTQVLDLRRKVGAVRRLHQQYRPAFDHPDVCAHCTRGMDLVDWPCPTIQALLDEVHPATLNPGDPK